MEKIYVWSFSRYYDHDELKDKTVLARTSQMESFVILLSSVFDRNG